MNKADKLLREVLDAASYVIEESEQAGRAIGEDPATRLALTVRSLDTHLWHGNPIPSSWSNGGTK